MSLWLAVGLLAAWVALANWLRTREQRAAAMALGIRLARLERAVQGLVFAHDDDEAHRETLGCQANHRMGGGMAGQIRRDLDEFMGATLRAP